MSSVDSIPGTGLSHTSSADFEDSFRSLPFEVYFFKHKRSRNEESGALPPVACPSGTSADTKDCMSDHLEAIAKVWIRKGFDSFSIFS